MKQMVLKLTNILFFLADQDIEMETVFSKAIEILAPWFWNPGETLNLLVEFLKEPPPQWECHEVDPSRVKELSISIKNNPLCQMLTESCGAVIFDKELSKANENGEVSEQDLLENQINLLPLISGEHRRQAMSGLNAVCFFLKMLL
jgi:hypothetical protein